MNKEAFEKLHQILFLTTIPLLILVLVLVRILSRKYNIFISKDLITLLISVIIGALLALIPGDNTERMLMIIPSSWYSTILVPSLTLTTFNRMDICKFTGALSATSVIVFLGVIMNACAVFATLYCICHPEWEFSLALLTTLAIIPIQSNTVIRLYKGLSNYNYLGIFLDSEYILGSCFCFTIFSHVQNTIDTKTAYLQSFAFFIVKIICALFFGYIMGKICGSLIYWKYNDPKNAVSISIFMIYVTYIVSELLCVFGFIVIVIMIMVISYQKHFLTNECNQIFELFWESLTEIVDFVILHTFIIQMMTFLLKRGKIDNVYFPIFMYFVLNLVRIICFKILGTFLFKMKYRMTLRPLLSLGWSGIKGSMNLVMLITLSQWKYKTESSPYFAEFLVIIFLFLSVNQISLPILLKLLGLNIISPTHTNSMNSCMMFINDHRIAILTHLKSNKYLADANWQVVREQTVLLHPYHKSLKESEQEHDDLYWTTNAVICPNCLKEVPLQFTKKEFLVKMSEAHIKVLKAKKMSVIKQYENGMIDKNILRMLVYTFENIMEAKVEYHIKIYKGQMKIIYYAYCILEYFLKDSYRPPPQSRWKLFCYYLIQNIYYEYFCLVYIVIYTIVFMFVPYSTTSNICHAVFLTPILSHIILNACKNENIYLKSHILSFWNIFDTLVFILDLIIIILIKINLHPWHISYWLAVRFFKLLYYLETYCSKLFMLVKQKLDDKLVFAYYIAITLLTACDDVMENLSNIISVKEIRYIYEGQLQKERSGLIDEIKKVQHEQPWVVITVQTKQAIRSTLAEMEMALSNLKTSGIAETVEYLYIHEMIKKKHTELLKISAVPMNPPINIFNNVPWMGNDEDFVNFLFNKARIVDFPRHTVVCSIGTKGEGVYIVISGVFKLTYCGTKKVLNALHVEGQIPIVDYMHTLDFDRDYDDVIMSGSTFGELSFLTQRAYDCTIVSETIAHAFFLSNETMKLAVKRDKNPVTGLEARMWKCSVLNLTVAVLMKTQLYQAFSQDQVKFKLERGFMPNLLCYETFTLTELMDDVILINGIVIDTNTDQAFIAPQHIRRTTQKLTFPSGSFQTISKDHLVKLFIIPIGDVSEIDVMNNEEELADLSKLCSNEFILNPNAKKRSKPATKDILLSRPSDFALDEDRANYFVNYMDAIEPKKKSVAFNKIQDITKIYKEDNEPIERN